VAQGFTTLPDFLRQIAEKERQWAKLNTLVAAAAAQPRSVQKKLHIQEEDNNNNNKTMAKEHNSETAPALHIDKRTLETNATNDMAPCRGLDGVTTSCIIEIASDSEPIQVEDTATEVESDTSVQSCGIMPGIGPLERESTHCNQGPNDSEYC
jgi:hypothetical protein